MSTVQGAHRTAPLGFNLGFGIGDDDALVERNIGRFLARFRLSADRMASMNQVHGTTIREVNEPGIYPETDAIVTREPSLGLAVRTADCVPVMLFAPGDLVIAAVHAGWRGTAEHIVAQTVEFLTERFGIEPEEILAYIGPSASVERYEVDEEVAAQFIEDAIVRSADTKPRLDLKKANTIDLIASGLNPENIEISPYCTISNPSLFHSYRRDGDRSGRMLALITLRDEE